MGKKNISIRRILVIALVGVTALVMFAFGAINYYREYHAGIAGLHTKLDRITAQLATALVNPMWTFNVTDVTKIIESFMKDKEVYAVFVEDQKRFIGRVQDKDRNPSPLQSRISFNGDLFLEKEIVFRGEKIGVLGVCLTSTLVKDELKSDLIYLLSSFFVLNFCLVTLLFFVFMRTVFSPLKIIGDYADRMSDSAGMEDTPIPGQGFAKELESLKNSIQNMIDQLRVRYLELKASQTALVETEKKYREIFNNAAEGIFQTSQEGRLLIANPALARILGYDSCQDILSSVSNVANDFYVEPSKREEFLHILNTRKRIRNFETEFLRKDKTAIPVSISAHSVFDEQKNFLYYEGMLQDITQKRKTEELRVAKEAAEATTKAKSLFLASMSHEIRTPMNAIMGLTGLVRKTELTAKQQDYLGKIGSSAHDLLGIINDILDFSKIEAGELHLDQVDFLLDDIWESLSDIFAKKCADKGLRFYFSIEDDVPSVLVGDPLRLRQILTNLAGNALKFTQEGEIVIQVGLVTQQSDRVMLRFSVKDTGIGIRQEKLTTIFSPFTQAEPFITRQYGGTGLGLSICKQLVEMMGGEIRLESKPGCGTCFIFTAGFGLQLREREHNYVCPANIGSRIVGKDGLKGARILLVEDNSINRQVATEILEGLGILVEKAQNGMEAVKKISSRGDDELLRFDAVLMDVQMPVMNGFVATRQIRQWESENLSLEGRGEVSGIPIIAMTAHAMLGDREKCIASGMNDYLTKPIDQNRLFATLKTWIPAGPDRPYTGEEEVGEAVRRTGGEAQVDGGDSGLSDFFGVKNLPGIDLAKGIERLQGNKKLYRKLLHEFVQNHADDLQKINQALADKNIQRAQRLAHTLKGVARSIAANHLSAIAEELEVSLRQGKPLQLAFLDTAQQEMSSLADSIGKIREPRKTDHQGVRQEEASFTIGTITPLLREMYVLLKMNRIDADKNLSGLQPFLVHADLETLGRELENSLEQFDFKGAAAVVENIAKQLGISLEGRDV